MKRVFVDANIVIDLLCERYPWFPKVLRIFSKSQRACPHVTKYLIDRSSYDSILTLFYCKRFYTLL